MTTFNARTRANQQNDNSKITTDGEDVIFESAHDQEKYN